MAGCGQTPLFFFCWVSVAGYEVVSSISWGSCPMSPCNMPSHLWTLRCSSLCCRDRPTRLRNTGFKYYLPFNITFMYNMCCVLLLRNNRIPSLFWKAFPVEQTWKITYNHCLEVILFPNVNHQRQDFIYLVYTNQTVWNIVIRSNALIASQYNKI